MMQKCIVNEDDSCSAEGCDINRETNDTSLIKMYYFPRDIVRRAEWAIATGRKNWTPSNNSLLCSTHFITGKPSSNPRHPDYIPSLFIFSKKAKEDEKRVSPPKKNAQQAEETSQQSLRSKKREKIVKASTSKKEKYLLNGKSSTSNSSNEGGEFIIVRPQVQDKEKSEEVKTNGEISDLRSSRQDFRNSHPKNSSENLPAEVLDDYTSSNHVEERTKQKIVVKRRKVTTRTTSTSPLKEVPKKDKFVDPIDREEIFGQYVASEMKNLKENPLLYLQTKQTILEILTSANFELIHPE